MVVHRVNIMAEHTRRNLGITKLKEAPFRRENGWPKGSSTTRNGGEHPDKSWWCKNFQLVSWFWMWVMHIACC